MKKIMTSLLLAGTMLLASSLNDVEAYSAGELRQALHTCGKKCPPRHFHALGYIEAVADIAIAQKTFCPPSRYGLKDFRIDIQNQILSFQTWNGSAITGLIRVMKAWPCGGSGKPKAPRRKLGN